MSEYRKEPEEQLPADILPKNPQLQGAEAVAGRPEATAKAIGAITQAKPALDEDKKAKIERRISEIQDPEARARLLEIYSKILGYNHEFADAQHEAVEEILEAAGIPANECPPHLLEKALKEASVLDAVDIDELKKLHSEIHKEGSEALENFIQSMKKPNNLLFLDPNLTKAQIEERMQTLAAIYEEFTQASLSDRDKMEEALCAMFDIPTITDEAHTYLDLVGKDVATMHLAGAENTNLIFLNGQLKSEVIKISKGRHDADFASILKLMCNMHVLALHLNHEEARAENIRVDLSFRDMSIYKDKNGNYKRMVRQHYAPGQSMKELPEAVKQTPEFIKAYQAFLRQIEAMKETDGIVLDISDSSAGTVPSRGDVGKTGNVFVKLPTEDDPNCLFTVIDPDVFDTVPGEHKFDAMEYIRKKGVLGPILALATAVTNQSRDRIVVEWQNNYVKKWLDKNPE